MMQGNIKSRSMLNDDALIVNVITKDKPKAISKVVNWKKSGVYTQFTPNFQELETKGD